MTARFVRRKWMQERQKEIIAKIRKRDAKKYDEEILRRITEAQAGTKKIRDKWEGKKAANAN